MSRFAIQALTIHGNVLSGILGHAFDLGRQVQSEVTDGLLHETLHTIENAKPGCEFRTRALKSLLTAPFLSTTADVPHLPLNGTTGLVMVGAKSTTDAPGYASGSVHVARTALNGVLWLGGIRWSAKGKAEAMVKGLFRSTAGATPATTDSLIALPTQPVPTEAFILQSLTLAGNTFKRVESLEITCEAPFEHDYDSGLPNPTDIIPPGANGAIVHRMVADVGELDIAEGTGPCSAVFVSLAQGGGIGSSTVTVTFNGAFAIEENWSGDGGKPIGRRLVVRPRQSGVTKPVTYAAT